MAYCRNCWTEVVDGAKFCQKCGQPTKTEQTENVPVKQEIISDTYRCDNCKSALAYGAKFCRKCGQPTKVGIEENLRRQREEAERKAAEERAKREAEETALKQKEMEEKLNANRLKCPSCGELLPPFAVKCHACGYEIRKEAAISIRELHRQLSKADTVEQRDFTIRSFPIPNSKEDIIEFMILASSNIIGEDETDIYEAWLAKFEQAYQKALIVFDEASDLEKIEKIYDNFQKNIKNRKLLKIKKLPKNIVKFFKQRLGAVIYSSMLALFLVSSLVLHDKDSRSIMFILFILFVIFGVWGFFMFWIEKKEKEEKEKKEKDLYNSSKDKN